MDLLQAEQRREALKQMEYVSVSIRQTIQNEFYATAFRKKIFKDIDELQKDADNWMKEYNEFRTHTGKYCFGKTPLETFVESKHLAHEKMLD